jgi:hypothetical protein
VFQNDSVSNPSPRWTTVVSIGHRSTFAAFHKRRIKLERHNDRPAALVEKVAERTSTSAARKLIFDQRLRQT